jgi:hypothetical protein
MTSPSPSRLSRLLRSPVLWPVVGAVAGATAMLARVAPDSLPTFRGPA